MRNFAVASLLFLAGTMLPQAVLAQSTNSGPAPNGTAPGTVNRTPSSGGATSPSVGQPQIGAPTAVEKEQQRKSDQDMTICKGC